MWPRSPAYASNASAASASAPSAPNTLTTPPFSPMWRCWRRPIRRQKTASPSSRPWQVLPVQLPVLAQTGQISCPFGLAQDGQRQGGGKGEGRGPLQVRIFLTSIPRILIGASWKNRRRVCRRRFFVIGFPDDGETRGCRPGGVEYQPSGDGPVQGSPHRPGRIPLLHCRLHSPKGLHQAAGRLLRG